MASPSVIRITLAKHQSESGVDYSPRHGARCPWCGGRTRIYKTMPWEDSLRIRYHRCEDDRCAIAAMGVTIKSIEVDSVGA